MRTLFPFLLAAAILLAPAPGSTAAPTGPVKVAAAYLDALEARDLTAAGALFDVRSSVFESGGDEGDWAHYLAHHLGTEIEAITSFKITRAEPAAETSADGTMAYVTWPIEYRIALTDERVIESRGTTTFVLVRGGGELKIRHLHWSSRPNTAQGHGR